MREQLENLRKILLLPTCLFLALQIISPQAKAQTQDITKARKDAKAAGMTIEPVTSGKPSQSTAPRVDGTLETRAPDGTSIFKTQDEPDALGGVDVSSAPMGSTVSKSTGSSSYSSGPSYSSGSRAKRKRKSRRHKSLTHALVPAQAPAGAPVGSMAPLLAPGR